MKRDTNAARSVFRDRLSLTGDPRLTRIVRRFFGHSFPTPIRALGENENDVEIQQLMAAGLWPPQTCQQERTIRASKKAFEARTAASKGTGEDWDKFLEFCDGGSTLAAVKDEKSLRIEKVVHNSDANGSSMADSQRPELGKPVHKTKQNATKVDGARQPTKARTTSYGPFRAGADHEKPITTLSPSQVKALRKSWRRKPVQTTATPSFSPSRNDHKRWIYKPGVPAVQHSQQRRVITEIAATRGAGNTNQEDAVSTSQEVSNDLKDVPKRFIDGRWQGSSDFDYLDKEPGWIKLVEEELEAKGIAKRFEDASGNSYVSAIAAANATARFQVPGYLVPALTNMGKSRKPATRTELSTMLKYNEERNYAKSVAILRRLISQGYIPCVDTLDAGMQAYIGLGQFENARALYNKYKSFFQPNDSIIASVLKTMMARRNTEAGSHLVRIYLNQAKDQRLIIIELLRGALAVTKDPDYICWLTLWCWKATGKLYREYYEYIIGAHLASGDWAAAQLWMTRLTEDGLKPDRRLYSFYIKAMAEQGRWNDLESLLGNLKEQGIYVVTSTMNHVLGKASDTLSLEAFDNLTSAFDATWDIFTWNIGLKVLLRSTADEAVMETVESFVGRMAGKNIKPDAVTMTTILTRLATVSSDALARLALKKCMAHLKRSNHRLFDGRSMESYIETLTHIRRPGVVHVRASAITLESYSARMHAASKAGNHQAVLDMFYDAVLADNLQPDIRLIVAALRSGCIEPHWKPSTRMFNRQFTKLCTPAAGESRPVNLSNLGLAMTYGLAKSQNLTIELSPNELSLLASKFDPSTSVDDAVESISLLQKFLETNGLKCGHHYVIHVANRFLSKGRYHDVIPLVRNFTGSSKVPTNAHLVEPLLISYAYLNDIDGVRWAVQLMKDKRIYPTDKMEFHLRKFVEKMQAMSNKSAAAEDSFRTVNELLSKTLKMRKGLKHEPIETVSKYLEIVAGEKEASSLINEWHGRFKNGRHRKSPKATPPKEAKRDGIKKDNLDSQIQQE